MLTNCNALSASRLKTVGPEFKKHTQLLVDMKKDLDYIFKKIRVIKTKLSAQYPTEFAEAQRNSLAEEAEEDEEFAIQATESKDEKEFDKTPVATDVNLAESVVEKDKNEPNEKRKSFKSNKSSSTDSNTNDFSCSSTESA